MLGLPPSNFEEWSMKSFFAWIGVIVVSALGGFLAHEVYRPTPAQPDNSIPAPVPQQAAAPQPAAPQAVPQAAGATLQAVRQRGFVQCGVNTGLAGFGLTDSQGKWVGFDIDVCRAVAAATLGDAEKVRYTPLTTQQRFTALQSKEVDILSRNTTWTLGRDTSLGLNFVAITFFDGQGFMVPKSANITSAAKLSGASVCVQPGTTTELNLADYFRSNAMRLQPVVIESFQELTAAFVAGRCDALTTDVSGLVSIRATQARPDDFVVLPEVISKEPLGPLVRHGDDQWFDIVKWTIFAMIEGEEKGITQANVDEQKNSADPAVKRLLGVTPGNGEALGLREDWAYAVLKQVGNYGESYERTITKSLGLERGLNNLWTKGGLLYAPPVR
jgi:general L-amino acid transport system substrate-binding protein